MTLDRKWVGRADKPPTYFDPSDTDPKWSWVHDSLVASWLFTEPGGDTVHDTLGRSHGTRVAGTGSKPTWGRNGELWGLTPIDSEATSGIDIPGGAGAALGDDFTPEHLTVEMWSVWMIHGGRSTRLFSKQTTGDEANHWIMGGATGALPRMRLKAGGTTVTHVINLAADAPVAGDLVHHTWTYDGATVRLYLNAVDTALATSANSGTVDGGSGVPIRLANSAYAGAADEWDAPIYKVAIYTTCLSPSQVYDLSHDPYGPYRPQERTLAFVPAAEASSLTIPIAMHHYAQMAS